METMFFGLSIEMDGVNSQDIAARLFICPRITPEHAIKMLEMLKTGKLSIGKFEEMTDGYIKELTAQKEASVDHSQIMSNKLDAWTKTFGVPTNEDYEYLRNTYNLTQHDLFGSTSGAKINNFKTAKELAAYVKQYIKGQDDAINKLAVSFFQHIDSKRKNYTSMVKTPVLLMGDTGTGKSELLRIFGQALNNECPIIRINSSEIVPSSWKGLHISDILMREIDGNTSIKDMEYAVIVFHEFDKLPHYNQKIVGSNGSDMDNDMMRDIMRLFETGHSLHLENGFDQKTMAPKTYRLPVDNLLIVFDGAFGGIENIVKKRLHIGNSIGYAQTKRDEYSSIDLRKMVTNDDLISYGFMNELVGRIGNIVVMNRLSSDVIYEIMTTAKNNILQAHIDYCSMNNIELVFKEEALRYIANIAYASGLGFRNVKTVLSQALNALYFEMPGEAIGEKQIVEISKDFIAQNINIK